MFFNPFRKNRKKLEFNLESCVKVGLLTQQEYLAIKKERAIAEWKSEVGRQSALKRKKKEKPLEVITETFDDEEIDEELATE